MIRASRSRLDSVLKSVIRFSSSGEQEQQLPRVTVNELLRTFESKELPLPWENPWLYALGAPPPPPEYTQVEVSRDEFRFVERLRPMQLIPDVPHHSAHPTPSGWRPPKSAPTTLQFPGVCQIGQFSAPPLDLPYYVRRNRQHTFDVFLENRRDTLDTTTVEFNYIELVVLKNVHGDVFVSCSILLA